MSFGSILKKIRQDNELTQEELAKRIDTSRSNIANYENDKNMPSIDVLDKLSKMFNCSIDYLLGKINVEDPKCNSNSAVVFVYGTIPAGIPMECIEDIIDTEEISADMLKGDKQFFGLKVNGHSMEPDYLDGDTIILEKVEDCESGTDCVVMVNGNDGTFKRVIKNEENQTIRLQPLNTSLDENGMPLYEPITFTKEQIKSLPVRIIGKVVELRRKK